MALNITWDRGLWLLLPQEFPDGDHRDEEAWIATVTAAFRRHGWRRGELADLGDYLRGLRANNRFGAHRFAYLGDPRRVLFSLDVFEAPHDPDSSLHDITGSDGVPTDARPPVVVDLVAAGLGPGVRVERALTVPRVAHEQIGAQSGPTEVILMVFWVFRHPAADVVITTTGSDPVQLASMMPDVEALIDGMVLEAG